MTDYKRILTDIARALVDKPDDVSVITVDESESEIELELSVAPEDMGKVIGRHGRIAKAIRTVMKAIANSTGKRITIEIK